MNTVFQECTPNGNDVVPLSEASSWLVQELPQNKCSKNVNYESNFYKKWFFFNYWVLWWWGWDPLERPGKVRQLSAVASWLVPSSWRARESGTDWYGSRCHLGKKESSLVSLCGTLVISQKFKTWYLHAAFLNLDFTPWSPMALLLHIPRHFPCGI